MPDAPSRSNPASRGPHPVGRADWPLARLEQELGLSRDTLLDWERRYGFPRPNLDASGERRYVADQVARLRLIKDLLEAGHAADRLVAMGLDDLEQMANSLEAPIEAEQASRVPGAQRAAIVERVAASDAAGLRGQLVHLLDEVGLDLFVRELVAPLNGDIGDAWMQGRIELFQEHLYTETVQRLLRHALQGLAPVGPGRPVVLLTTASDESHGLGLLMAEAVLALAGCRCVSLGVQTPVWDIARAAAALKADVVALSHSGAADPARVTEALNELRTKLPRAIELWAGGTAAVLRRRPVDGVRVMTRLEQVGGAVAAWRARHLLPT